MPQLLPAASDYADEAPARSPLDEALAILEGMTDQTWKRDREMVARLVRETGCVG